MMPWGKLAVVVADGGHARFLMPRGRPWSYVTQDALDSLALHRKAAEFGSDAPGRSFESASPTRHAIQPRQDPHEQAKHDFAGTVAQAINAGIDEALFDHFLLVALPPVLADIQAGLSSKAKAKLIGTLAKDLAKTPDREIADHIAPTLRQALIRH